MESEPSEFKVDLDDFLQKSIFESVVRHGFNVSSNARDYLSHMLKEFVVPGKLFTKYDFYGEQVYGLKPVTWQMFDTLETRGAERAVKTQNLAEHCLFLVGFCYDLIKRKGTARFHTDIGAFAYESLGRLVSPPGRVVQTVYPEVAEKFWEMGAIIGDLHLPNLKSNGKKIQEVMYLLDKTRDKRYQLLLKGIFDTEMLIVPTGWG